MITLHHGDCLTVLKTLNDASVDSVVTDPPYGLSFMGKKWDYDVPSVDIWRQVFRVLKPGGYLLSFGGSRTYHRIAAAIEQAGFDLHDCILWTYAAGMPKSLDVSKAIDKVGGISPRQQAIMLKTRRQEASLTREQVAQIVGCTEASVRDWEEGRARAVGRPVEFIVPSPEYRIRLADLLGYSADERRSIGVSTDRRGDGTVIGLGHSGMLMEGGVTEVAKRWRGWGTCLKPSYEPVIIAGKGHVPPFAGRRFYYSSKAGKDDRAGSKHPSIKPVALMAHLVRLVAPAGGTVLDPFAGSGTTGVAAVYEGRRAILIEREAEYCEDIRRRAPLFVQEAA